MKTMRLLALLALFALPAFAQESLPDAAPDSELLSPAAPEADYFARDTYRIDTVVCPFKGQIEYEPGDMECGLLEVPENREDPDSRFIELHFVKLNSRWGKDDGEEEDEEEDEEEFEDVEPLELNLDEEPEAADIEKEWFILKVQSNRETSIRDALTG